MERWSERVEQGGEGKSGVERLSGLMWFEMGGGVERLKDDVE